jgi:hypothetical protein
MQSLSQNRTLVTIAAAGALGGMALTILGQYLFSSTPIQTTPRSKRLQAIYAFLDSYRELSPDSLLKHTAPNFTHQVLPSSLEMPLRDRKGFAVHAKGITSIVSSFSMVPQVVYEDSARNAVFAHCKMIAELNALGPWENECVMWMQMSSDGTKIVEMKEFVDSSKARLLKEKLTAEMNAEKTDSIMYN